MPRTKCNITSYEPSVKADYAAYIEPTRPQPPVRQHRDYNSRQHDHPRRSTGGAEEQQRARRDHRHHHHHHHHRDNNLRKYYSESTETSPDSRGGFSSLTSGTSGSGTSVSSSMYLERYHDVEKFKRASLLYQEQQDTTALKKKKLKYEDYHPSLDDSGSLSDEVYIVRQNWGYLSILFSLAQTVIMGLMILKCGVAPLRINPMIGPYPDVLSEWGAKNSVLILEENEWYRLITPILLHAGIIHLLCNIAVQLETGVFFEKEWGSARWLIIYMVSAVGSSILSVIAMPNALSVGSSGAVMGLFGGKLSEVVMRACERARTKQDLVGQQVRKEQCCAVSCSVIVIMLFSFIPYVDWAAHLGGLIAGIIVGIFIFACEIESIIWRVLWSLVGMAATIISFTLALDYMYSGVIEPMEELRDVCAYYTEALGADGFECQCQREG